MNVGGTIMHPIEDELALKVVCTPHQKEPSISNIEGTRLTIESSTFEKVVVQSSWNKSDWYDSGEFDTSSSFFILDDHSRAAIFETYRLKYQSESKTVYSPEFVTGIDGYSGLFALEKYV